MSTVDKGRINEGKKDKNIRNSFSSGTFIREAYFEEVKMK